MPLLPRRRVAAVLRRTARAAPAAVAVAALTAAGCGRSDAVAVPAGRPVALALSEFRVAPQDVRVAAGRRTFAIRNAGTMVHRFELRSEDGRRRLRLGRPLRPGERATEVVDLAPGRYVVRCAQPRHNTLGEHGAVVVE